MQLEHAMPIPPATPAHTAGPRPRRSRRLRQQMPRPPRAMGDLSPVHRLADAAATTAALRSKWDGVARDAPSARHHLLDSVAEEDEECDAGTHECSAKEICDKGCPAIAGRKHHDGEMRAAGEFDSLATIAEASPEPESVPLSNGGNVRTPCDMTERHALQADSQASLVEIATECDGSDAGEPAVSTDGPAAIADVNGRPLAQPAQPLVAQPTEAHAAAVDATQAADDDEQPATQPLRRRLFACFGGWSWPQMRRRKPAAHVKLPSPAATPRPPTQPQPRMVGTGTFYERQLTFDGIDSIYEIVEVMVPADDSDDGAAQRASAGRPRRKFRWWWSRKEAQDSVITL
nr:hypothetical protein HK105_006783 [Polyrhizophydium stewartii]